MEWLGHILYLILVFVRLGSALECYVCENQDGNRGKCLKTIQTCLQEEDACLSEITWGSLPYWSGSGADKQYYVSKQCSSRSRCEDTQKKYLPFCHRIWYEDWKCAECCQGDRCNYYVTLGAGTVKCSFVVILLGILTVVIGWWHT